MALKELGLSLVQARRLMDGVTLEELQGMLILRRAQLEHELEQHTSQLLGIEARLRHIAKEGAMPADDDLVRLIEERGYQAVPGPGREVWVHEVDDIADVAQQVFEIQLPFIRPDGPAME